MDAEKRARLEANGYRVGDAAEWLGLTDAERKVIDLRINLSRAIRAAREAKGLTQAAAAKMMKTSQSRFAVIESGVPSGVSIDLMVTAMFALDGDLVAAIRGEYPPTTEPVEAAKPKRARQ